MKKTWFGVLAVAAMFALSQFAKADTISYTFTGSAGESGSFTVSGPTWTDLTSGTLTLTGTSSYNGTYDLTVNPNPGSLSNSPNSTLGGDYFIYDNIVYPTGQLGPSNGGDLDNSGGLLFALNGIDPGTELNIWGNGVGNPYSLWIGVGGTSYPLDDSNGVSLTVTYVTSEPMSLLLFGSGMLILAFGIFWRSRRAVSAPDSW